MIRDSSHTSHYFLTMSRKGPTCFTTAGIGWTIFPFASRHPCTRRDSRCREGDLAPIFVPINATIRFLRHSIAIP